MLVGQTPLFQTTVERIDALAEGVKRITLRSHDGTPLPSWSPGAHIDVGLPGGLIRQYSLCGHVSDGEHWQFAVLREPQSRGGSSWIHERLNNGDTLQVRGPRNEFPLADALEYVFVAGGIGITPLLPMIREVSTRMVPWHLTYGGRRIK